MTDEEKQQKYMELRLMDQQIKDAQQQVQLLDSQQTELNSIQEALDELKNEKKGTEILVPIASGIFMTAQLKDAQHLLVNVGAGTTVVKSTAETKGLLEKQKKELSKLQKELTEKVQELVNRAIHLQSDLQEAADE